MNNLFKSAIIIILALSFSSCYKDFQRHIVGNGKLSTETRNLSSFEEVHSSGSFEIEIINDTIQPHVEIEAESNIIPIIETTVLGNELEIEFENHASVSTHEPIKIKVFTRKLSGIELSGSGSIFTHPFSGDHFEASLSGSGTFSFDFTGITLSTDISGSGNMMGNGKVQQHDIKISGSGEINSFDLETENTTIEISGSGNARIFATKTLKAEISGSGSVSYKGNPAVTSTVSGSGKIRPF